MAEAITQSVVDFVSIVEAARMVGVRPRDISDAIYAQKLDASLLLVVASRRLIPRSYLPTVREVMIKAGRLPTAAASA